MGILTLTGTSATASAASQAKYEALNGCAVQLRVRVDQLRTIPGYTIVGMFTMPGKDDLRFQFFPTDPGQFTLRHFETAQGGTISPTFNFSSLPANGNDVVLYVERLGTTVRFAVGTPDGAELVAGTNTSGALPGITSVGSGTVTLPADANQPGLIFDAIAVLNAARTGNARFAKPLTTDADVVGVYYFDETSGSTTADATGGTALTLSGGAALSAGGSWDGAGGGGGGTTKVDTILAYYL